MAAAAEEERRTTDEGKGAKMSAARENRERLEGKEVQSGWSMRGYGGGDAVGGSEGECAEE